MQGFILRQDEVDSRLPWNIYRYKELKTVDYDREYQALKDVESLKMAEAVIKPMEYQFLNDST